MDRPLFLDAPELMLRAVLDDVGLAYAAPADVEPLISPERFVRVLTDWCPPAGRLHLYYPARRYLPLALRALIDWLRQATHAGPSQAERP